VPLKNASSAFDCSLWKCKPQQKTPLGAVSAIAASAGSSPAPQRSAAPAEDLRNRELWRDLTSVGWVISITTRDGQECSEVRAYVSSLKPDAKNLARAVRGHWGIENGQHWVLDIVFNEDQNRARLHNAAENLALLRRLALNLVRREGSKKASLRVKRRAAGWNDDLLAQILTAGTS
jgi:predicted transposase YbfD/YdcC